MKRTILTAGALTLWLSSQAIIFSVGGISYDTLDTGMVEVVAPESSAAAYSGNVVIPSLVDYAGRQFKVISVGSHAFANCSDVESIEFPSGLQSIADYACYGCDGLRQITLPVSLESIGDRAFAHCRALESVDFPASLTSIGESAFAYCSSLTELASMPLGGMLGDGAFAYCTSIAELDLSAYTGLLGERVFSNCSGLSTLKLNDDMTEIPAYTFSDCQSLSTLTLPALLNSIGHHAFSGCIGLEEIQIPASVKLIEERGFSGCNSVKRLEFNTSALSIGDGAFENLSSLPYAFIMGISEIGDSSFANCTSLEWIEIEDGVEEIGSRAFSNCPKLSKVYAHADWPAKITVNTFDSTTELEAELFVKEDAVERYSMAAYWNRFANIAATDKFPLSVDNVADSGIAIRLIEGGISIAAAGERVVVSTLDGRCSDCGIVYGDKDVMLAGGLYIVKIGNQARKIMIP